MLNWSAKFNIFCFLDNAQYHFSTSPFECMLAAGASNILTVPSGQAFDSLQKFKDLNSKEWIFGHFSYDLKNEVEELSSNNNDNIQFPEIFFFVPQVIVILTEQELKISSSDSFADTVFKEISTSSTKINNQAVNLPELKARYTREEYVSCVKKLQQHILLGDCYEMNFCQEFFIENASLDVLRVHDKLNRLSPNPFSAFYKVEHNYLLCASPERFLKKTGDKVFSQPIKGTARRVLHDRTEDEDNRRKLSDSHKEKAENVMIVDLVRNDLSKICVEGSVKVEELFGIYSFPQVHQMISTITGKIKTNDLAKIFRATFPMGSMTGAPKKKVMELIERYERTKRGIFSGALGYITPAGDFDFNVVIRSIVYNSTKRYISVQAGSAITFNSDPEKEYEECLLKMQAMKSALT